MDGLAILIEPSFLIMVYLFVFAIYVILKYAIKKYRNEFRNNWKREVSRFVLYLYIICVIAIVLLPIIIPPSNDKFLSINFDVRNIWDSHVIKMSLINIVGNICLFVPFPILCVFDQHISFLKLKKALVMSAIFSFSIEILQLLEMRLGFFGTSIRICDINDFLLNVTGGILGWAIMTYYNKKLKQTEKVTFSK